MGLFDIIGFAAGKAYGKYKDSKMESSMDNLLEIIDKCSLNIEVVPYKEGENPRMLKGIVYNLNKDEIDKSCAPYIVTTNAWLKSAGIDIDDNKIYMAAFNEKGGYAILNLRKKYPNVVNNYANKYNDKGVVLSLLVYLNESNSMLSMPKYFQDKDGRIKLSKKAAVDQFSVLENNLKNDPAKADEQLKNFYLRAKVFAYLLDKELNTYDKDNLESAFKKFEEKHGKNAIVNYNI